MEAPVREIAAKAGVGVGTIYRHFPTRADLVIAVFRHQVDACAEASAPYVTGARTSLGGGSSEPPPSGMPPSWTA